jgi:hypothetical protein
MTANEKQLIIALFLYIENLSAIIRIQNGNKYPDINKLLEDSASHIQIVKKTLLQEK